MLDLFSARDRSRGRWTLGPDPDIGRHDRDQSLDQRDRQPGNDARDLVVTAEHIRVSDNRKCVVINVKATQQLFETRARSVALVVMGCLAGAADVLVGRPLRQP